MDARDFPPLSAKEFHILLALAGDPQNGYQVVQLVEENSLRKVRLSPATLYMNLDRLVKKQLLREVTDEVEGRGDGRRQRFWTLTQLGAQVLRAEGSRLAADAKMVMALGPEE